jgi:hypothetical protein
MAERLSLQRFLASLDDRLTAMSAGDIRAAIRTHAEALPSDQRHGFLEMFAPVRTTEDAPRLDWPIEDDPLLAAIDALVERISSGSYFEGFGWDDEIHDERSFGDESWVTEMDGLFQDTQAAFLAGDLRLARSAYERLLRAFELDQEVGTFCGSSPALETVSTDVAEAQARYLRAVYETTPPAQRAGVLLGEWFALPSYGATTLATVRETRASDLPDLSAFRPDWISQLSSPAAEQASELRVRALLSESVQLHSGADGLAALARRAGTGRGERFLDWVEALRRAGREADAADAAREALTDPSPEGAAFAQVAEQLAELVGDDADALLVARRAAWRARPSDERLLALHAAIPAEEVDRVLAGEITALDEVANTESPISGRLRALLLLLAGRTDAAAALLGRDGGTRPMAAGSVIVPYLLAAACAGPGRPGWEMTRVARLLRGIDEPRRWDWTSPLGPYQSASDEPTLSDLLTARLTRCATPRPQRAAWLQLARTEIEGRVRAIVSDKHRSRYGEAARLAACCAEALAMADDEPAGDRFIASLRGDFSRHIAFRRELDAALTDAAAPTRGLPR